MKKKKKQIFQLLRNLILEGETKIHNDPSFKEDMNVEDYKEHKKLLGRIKSCPGIEELFDLMNEEFGMDVWTVIETYLVLPKKIIILPL